MKSSPLSLLMICLCLFLVLPTTVGITQDDVAAEAQAGVKPAKKIAIIAFGNADSPMEIGPYSESYLNRKLERAKQLGADVVVIEMDSPGGYLDEGLSMAGTLRDLDWAKTVAFVPRQSLSAGSFLCLACDEVLVAKNGFIGDAGPIFLDENFMFQHASEKVRSDLAAKIRKLAEDGGRPPALAEAMVDMDLEVFKVTHADNGKVSYMSDAELKALEDPTEWKKGPLLQESKEGVFLEVSGPVAVEIGLAEAVVNSRAAIAKRYGQELENVVILESTWIDTLVIVLNYRSVTVLLFIIGLIAAYIELAAPGIGVGGLVAGLCFGLFFWSRFCGGTAGWLEVLLFLAGVCFIAMELFVIPGFGVAGFGGVLLIISSLVMASERFGGTQGVSLNGVLASLLTVCVAGVGSIVGMWAASKYFGGLKLFSHLTLEPPKPVVAAASLAGAGAGAVSSHALPLSIGDQGVADSMLRPAGRALFGETYYDVVTDGSFVDPGSRIRIIKLSGTHITVRQVEETS